VLLKLLTGHILASGDTHYQLDHYLNLYFGACYKLSLNSQAPSGIMGKVATGYCNIFTSMVKPGRKKSNRNLLIGALPDDG